MKTTPVIITIYVLLTSAFGCLGWRLFYLQHSRADDYAKKSYRSQHASIPEPPERGRIYDSGGIRGNGHVIAASNKIQTVFIDPGVFSHWDEVMETAVKLQPVLGIPAPEICDTIYKRRNSRFVKLKEEIDEAQRDAIKAAALKGIAIQSSWKRYYPSGQLTSHVVGFIGGSSDPGVTDKIGLAGIERRYDSLLKGSQGNNVLVVDKHRFPIGMDTSKTKKVLNGSSLILTIDSTIQEFARSELMKAYKEFRAESATAVVMNPWTGAILAMVSLPDFDPREFSTADPESLRNRAVTDPFEPGSIFKPIVAAIALDGGDITINEQIYCERGNFAKYRIGEWAGHHFGNLTIKEILTESSNIGMAKIGLKMGDKNLHRGVKLFGFGSKTNIDIPGEDKGLVWPLKWDNFCLTRVSYGHQVTVTAVQMVRSYAILANGGSPVTPHLVRAIVDQEGKVTELTKKTSLAGRLIKEEVAHWIVRDALANVVNEGTGKEAALEKWQVFGKTGTANIAINGRYDEKNYTASFVGGAPAERPAVVMLVSVRKPDKTVRGVYSGGKVAAPVFKNILEKTLTYLERSRD